MAEWRDRKFVPDSDEEEEEEEDFGGRDNANSPPAGQTRVPLQDVEIEATKDANNWTSIASGLSTLPGFGEGEKPLWHGTNEALLQNDIPLGTAEMAVFEKDASDMDKLQMNSSGCSTAMLSSTRRSASQMHVNRILGADDDIDKLQQGDGIDQLPMLPRTQFINNFLQDVSSKAPPTDASLVLSEKIGLEDTNSSPLSEAISSYSLYTPIVPNPDPNVQRQASPSPTIMRTTPSMQRNLTPSIQEALLSGADAYDFVRPARQLRRRNPIQVHPYALEGERYRQTLRARGIRPLRFDQLVVEENNINEIQSQEESCTAEDSESVGKGFDFHDLESSSPPKTPSAPSLVGQDIDHLSEDDFPDLDTLLSRHLPGVSANGYKRRKVAQTVSEKRQNQGTVQNSATNNSMRFSHIEIPVLDHVDVVSNVPPSPPHSQSPQCRNTSPARDGFRFPAGTASGPLSNQLQTPLPSSEQKISPFIEMSYDSKTNEGAVSEVSDSHIRSSSILLDESSEGEREHELLLVQRRMRGVLPASWLKLDLKKQNKDRISTVQSPDRTSLSPNRDTIQRGVARPLLVQRRRYSNDSSKKKGLIELSDDSLPDDSLSYLKSRVRGNPTSALRANVFKVSDDEDQMEDNRIDSMLPPKPRQPRHPNRIKTSRKSKMIDHCFRKTIGETEKCFSRPPMLSIDDAVNYSNLKNTPKFLRSAARNARSRADKGRHSPSRKYLRLATREDTADVQTILEEWREGTINPRQSISQQSMKSGRPPLSTTSGNGQEYSATSVFTGKKLLQSSRHTLKGSKRSSGRRQFQQSMEQALNSICTTRHDNPDRHKKSAHQYPMQSKQDRGKFSSSLALVPLQRPAILEFLKCVDSRESRQNIVQPRIQTWMSRPNFSDQLGPILDGFSDCPNFTSELGQRQKNGEALHSKTVVIPEHTYSASLGRRKKTPQHFDVENPDFNQNPVPSILHEDFTASELHVNPVLHDDLLLEGLEPLGTSYPLAFDIVALPSELRFQNTTFIGSGAFSKSLRIALYRDLDYAQVVTTLSFDDVTYEWGPWNENVSSQLEHAFDKIKEALICSIDQSISQDKLKSQLEQSVQIQEFIICYANENLYFKDSVDRASYLQRFHSFLLDVLAETDDFYPTDNGSTQLKNEHIDFLVKFRTKIMLRTLIMVNQIRQIANHELVPECLKSEIEALFLSALRQSVTATFSIGLDQVYGFVRQCTNLSVQERGISDDQYRLESIVVQRHIIKQYDSSAEALWTRINPSLLITQSKTSPNVRFLEVQWLRLFTILPLLNFSEHGLISTAKSYDGCLENWAFVKTLIQPVLDAYWSHPHAKALEYNSYCCTVLGRCLYLIVELGWSRCDNIIGTIFDFFAKNNLGHLHKEETHSSPKFLAQLNQSLPTVLSRGDRCFDIFLKILGSGLRSLQKVYSVKKIRDVVWRLMPNHDRRHPKDEIFRQDDLDALRNHHDLLCILYWGSPPGYRPRLSVIRSLVHLETSHREACHVNIRAWSNLVRFQLSTGEEYANLVPFGEWQTVLLDEILRQHHLARTEVESLVLSAQSTRNDLVSKQLQESTISRNQRHVEAILSDALTTLKSAIGSARSLDAAKRILPKSLSQVFGLFDAKQPRMNKAVIEGLEVILTFAKKGLAPEANEDSQGYGDWSGFDDELGIVGNTEQEVVPKEIYESIRRLLSNCFGSETLINDAILLKVVETWAVVAQLIVNGGGKTWDDYLGPYGNESWCSLGSNEQSRKFTPLFLAMLVENNVTLYHQHKDSIYRSWIASLVERESLLKFQHQFSNAILNADRDNPLLASLPFCINTTTGTFNIAISAFRERRLSLISCILSNMRESLDFNTFHSSSDRAALKREYADILKHLMTTMKRNYQELGHGSVRGAYVEFVHSVVGFLQQYTAEISTVDRFFTDSASFPLPATDPTYVVGRLKNYSLRLQDSRILKQLSGFIQAASERAAADDQQHYLTEQLYVATNFTHEPGNSSKPTLRSLLVRMVFPAYIENALSTSCGWLLALPILRALKKNYEVILQDLDGLDSASVLSVHDIFMTTLESLKESINSIRCNLQLLQRTSTLRILAAYYSLLTAMLPTLDYLFVLKPSWQAVMQMVGYFKEFGTFTDANIVDGQTHQLLQEADFVPNMTVDQYNDVRVFTTNELRETLSRNWVCHENRYYVIRGSLRRQVKVDVGSWDEEKALLIAEIRNFDAVLTEMPGLNIGTVKYYQTKVHLGIEDLWF